MRRPVVTAALALVCLHAAQARADIWGYLDADGTPRYATSKLDERYELMLRESQAVEPHKPAYVLLKPPAPAAEAPLAETPTLELTVATQPPPVLSSPFERSKSYQAVSPLLKEASSRHGIDYSLLKALISAESGFNPEAVSPKGAVGLMQLIPQTAERYGVTGSKGVTVQKKLTDPKTNIQAGTRYLADLIKMFPGRLELAIAAYNAGEGAVQRAGNKIPNYPETQNYVKTVMQMYTGLGGAPRPSTAAGRERVEFEADTSSPRAKVLPLAEPVRPTARTERVRG